jgi:hypothetical protein
MAGLRKFKSGVAAINRAGTAAATYRHGQIMPACFVRQKQWRTNCVGIPFVAPLQ